MTAPTKRRPGPAAEYVPAPADYMAVSLGVARAQAEGTRRVLIRRMTSLKDDLDRCIARLSLGLAPNSLGELQANATMIEAACGRLAAEQEAHERLEALAVKLDLSPAVVPAPLA